MTNNDKLSATKVDNIDENTEYVARMEFRSVGESAEVRPNFEYSHIFPDDYEGEFPSAFLALRDMAMMLNMMLHSEDSNMRPAPGHENETIAIDALDDLEASRSTKN